MKTSFLSLLLAICLIAALTSCIYDPQTGTIVVSEKICVNMDQYETDGDIGARAVCDKFRESLMADIEKHGATLDDVNDISVTSATYKMVKLEGHDWHLTADVKVSRVDVSDGPATLVSFSNQSIDALNSKPTTAALNAAGVALLNRALDDLLAGGDPQVVIELVDESIVPVPSVSDPLAFKWLACVEFQAVVDVSSKKK
jgi:hypothetical protein